jgi:N-acetylmuramate 1-kinase
MIDLDQMTAFVKTSLGMSRKEVIEIGTLGGRGSNRAYYRVYYGDSQRAILCHYDPIRVENAYFVGIADFLHQIGVPAPLVIDHDSVLHLILMTDLGEVDLFSLKEEPWEKRKSLYEAALKHISRLHSFNIRDLPSDLVLMEGFSPDLYRWEREYFLERFVKGVCHVELEPSMVDKLGRELELLTGFLMEPPLSLVHRDFQSQNVMVIGNEIFFIDFQGMRMGSPFYDLGSLLFDPYVHFAADERNELLLFYFKNGAHGLDWSVFTERFLAAAAQRLMQALCAFGFLGLAKGHFEYLAHIPTGLANLSSVADQSRVLPTLCEVCNRCQSALKK